MRKLLFILILLLPLGAFSQEFPKKSKRLVNDYSNTLSKSEINDLEQLLVDYDRESSVQIAIVLMKTLDGYPIDEYAFKLGEKWGIGQGETDNGALILLSIEERKMWIATGYGIEGSLTDAHAKRIVENEMKPRFKKGDFHGGLKAASETIILATRGEYEGQGGNGNEDPKPVIFLVIGVIAFFWFIFWGIAALEAKNYARVNGLTFWAAWALLNASRRNHGGSWSSFSGGSGGFSGGGGGSFGGFGGGSFGGGGAGGSW